VHDPAHGYVLTLAAGGVLTEILKDRVSRVLPVTQTDIETALDELRIAPMIRGYRGKPGANRLAIVSQILGLQAFVEAHREHVYEVEINPLLCTTDSAYAADALLRTEEEDLR